MLFILNQLFGRLGRAALMPCRYFVTVTTFGSRMLLTGLQGLVNSANRNALANQVFFTGIGAIPVGLFLALLAAVGITAQVLHISEAVSQDINLVELLTRIVLYELAPLATALLITSRSGSAIIVDLGNMKLRGEIDALHYLAVNLDGYLLAPRILACSLCQLVLSTYFAIVALYGGIAAAGLLYSQRYFGFLNNALSAVSVDMLSLFILKNLLFGGYIGAIACFQALHTETCVTELPRQTQKAIIRSICLVFVVNIVFIVALG